MSGDNPQLAVLPAFMSTDCCICLAPLISRASVHENDDPGLCGPPCVLACGHVFHMLCIRQSMEVKHQCPVCRHAILPSSSILAHYTFDSTDNNMFDNTDLRDAVFHASHVQIRLSNLDLLPDSDRMQRNVSSQAPGTSSSDETRLDRRARKYARLLSARNRIYASRIGNLQQRIAAQTTNVQEMNCSIESLGRLVASLDQFVSASSDGQTGALLLRAAQTRSSLDSTIRDLRVVSDEIQEANTSIALLQKKLAGKKALVDGACANFGHTGSPRENEAISPQELSSRRVAEWLGSEVPQRVAR